MFNYCVSESNLLLVLFLVLLDEEHHAACDDDCGNCHQADPQTHVGVVSGLGLRVRGLDGESAINIGDLVVAGDVVAVCVNDLDIGGLVLGGAYLSLAAGNGSGDLVTLRKGTLDLAGVGGKSLAVVDLLGALRGDSEGSLSYFKGAVLSGDLVLCGDVLAVCVLRSDLDDLVRRGAGVGDAAGVLYYESIAALKLARDNVVGVRGKLGAVVDLLCGGGLDGDFNDLHAGDFKSAFLDGDIVVCGVISALLIGDLQAAFLDGVLGGTRLGLGAGEGEGELLAGDQRTGGDAVIIGLGGKCGLIISLAGGAGGNGDITLGDAQLAVRELDVS